MNGLEELEEKIGLLLKKHTATLAENKKLRKALSAKDEKIAALESRLNADQQDATAKAVAAALPDKKERTAARKQIDAVIKEIDKILIKLND